MPVGLALAIDYCPVAPLPWSFIGPRFERVRTQFRRMATAVDLELDLRLVVMDRVELDDSLDNLDESCGCVCERMSFEIV